MIQELKAEGKTISDIAFQFSISERTISNALNYKQESSGRIESAPEFFIFLLTWAVSVDYAALAARAGDERILESNLLSNWYLIWVLEPKRRENIKSRKDYEFPRWFRNHFGCKNLESLASNWLNETWSSQMKELIQQALQSLTEKDFIIVLHRFNHATQELYGMLNTNHLHRLKFLSTHPIIVLYAHKLRNALLNDSDQNYIRAKRILEEALDGDETALQALVNSQATRTDQQIMDDKVVPFGQRRPPALYQLSDPRPSTVRI